MDKYSGVIFLAQRPLFTNTQLNRLSEIFMVIGEIFFASAVITPLLTGIDYSKFPVVLSGLIGSIFFWIFSIILVRNL